MSSLPEFNPYEVLSVAKDASLAEIKSAHRKLVLKCHPDKIKDESLRSNAQDQFQKVQQAYELLSDETSRTKYDTKARLAELKREMQSNGSAPYPRYRTRESRDGRIYEERAPADDRDSPEPPFFEEEGRYFEPPRPMARKNDEYGARTRSRATEEKKKTKVPSSTTHAAKESRTSAKAARAGRDKFRTKERRREATEKYTYESDQYLSDSDSTSEFEIPIPVKRPGRYRESKPRSNESTRRSEHSRYEDDMFSDVEESKHDKQYNTAADYIRRSRETLEPERRHRPSRSPQPDISSSRHPSRTKRSSKEQVRPSTSRQSSLEDLGPTRPRIPTLHPSATFPGVKVPSPSRPSHQSSRSSTSMRSQSRSKPQFVQSEPANLMRFFGNETSRGSKSRSDRYDSGYASTSPAPEIPLTAEPSPKSSRYKAGPAQILVEPPNTPPHPSLRPARTFSPPRSERRTPPRSSTTTYMYAQEPGRDRLYGELDLGGRPDKKSSKYAREIGPDGVTYTRPCYEDYHRQPSTARRQSAY